MFDDLAALFEESALAAYLDYRDRSRSGVAGRSRDLRSAIEAASALFHFREHLPGTGALSRTETERRCPEYALLGDVSNAAKHRKLTSVTPHGPPLVTSAADLYEQIVITYYDDDEGRYAWRQKTVAVRVADGSEQDLMVVMTSVLNFWEIYLTQLGVRTHAREFRYDGDTRHRTRLECEATQLQFELVQGHRFHQRMRFLEYDPHTGTATPVDFGDSVLTFEIYQPQGVELALRHDASGRERKAVVDLDEGERASLARLRSPLERDAFVRVCPDFS